MARPLAPLDREQVHAGGAQRDFVEPLAHQRGTFGDEDALLALGEPVALGPFAQSRTTAGGARVDRLRGQQPAREQHVEDAEDEQRQAERREAEEAESLRPLADQFGVDDEVRRGGDEGQHAADEGGKAQRHHQPAWRHAAVLRDAQYDRDEDSDHRRRAHQRAEAAHRRHQQDEQTVLAGACLGVEPVAEAARDAGAHQALPDHEQGGDQDDRRIAEPRQRLVHGDDAGERHRHEHEQRHGVHARPVDHEHGDRCREHEQDEGKFEVHHGFLRRAMG